jgi:hypothetical protein
MIGIDLDDLGLRRPIVEPVLRQRAERAQPRAEREHDVGRGDQLHRRLGALVAERAAPQRMVAGEGIVVQVGIDHRRLQPLGELDRLAHAVRKDHPAAGDDDRELRRGEQVGRRVEARLGAGAAQNRLGRGDFIVGLAVEIVARNVELGRAALGRRHVEAAAEQLGHPRMLGDMGLISGDLREDRQLLGLLEAAEPDRRGAGLRGDRDDRRMRPEGGGDRGDEIGDPRPVLGDADAVAARGARIAVGHMGGALLVDGRDEPDARRRKQVERVHVGGADDAEDIRDALGDQRLDEGFAGGHARHRGGSLGSVRTGAGRTGGAANLFHRSRLVNAAARAAAMRPGVRVTARLVKSAKPVQAGRVAKSPRRKGASPGGSR